MECPCLPCLLINNRPRLPTIQHIVRGRRLGHLYTYSSCIFHHLGLSDDPKHKDLTPILGPSLANGRKPFEAFFGDEITVLLPIQNLILEAFVSQGWSDYNVPTDVRRAARSLWKTLKT